MLYCARITTPASTLISAKLSTVLKVNPGIIYKVEIDFPYGSCRLLHVQIFDGPTQIYPKTIDESFIGHGTLISFDDEQAKTEAPYELVIKTWNEDDYYEHKVQARLYMLGTEEYAIKYLGAGSQKETGDALAALLSAQKQTMAEKAKEAFAFLKMVRGR